MDDPKPGVKFWYGKMSRLCVVLDGNDPKIIAEYRKRYGVPPGCVPFREPSGDINGFRRIEDWQLHARVVGPMPCHCGSDRIDLSDYLCAVCRMALEISV